MSIILHNQLRSFAKKNFIIFFQKHLTNLVNGKLKFFSENKSRNSDERKKRKFNTTKLGFFLPFITFPTLLAKENEDDVPKNSRRVKFNFIADVVEEVLPSIVQIEIKQSGIFGLGQTLSNGSGFIISNDGIIITNAHVVRDKLTDLNVKLHGERSFKGKVIKIDDKLDLAVIKIDCENLKPVKLGDSSTIRTGEFVIALGNPLSLDNTVTSGVVSNPKRDGSKLGLNNELYYIQTDTIVTHGNSGGPLVNLDGEVIGINSMTATAGISFAIPSKYVIDFIHKIDQKPNKKKNFYLGMKLVSITPQIQQLFSLQSSSDIKLPSELQHGSLVIEVASQSPADKAGLKRGDVIVEANETPVNKNSDFFDTLAENPNLSLKIIRGNRKISVHLTGKTKPIVS